MINIINKLLLIAGCSLMATTLHAQTLDTPFSLIGHIQKFELDTSVCTPSNIKLTGAKMKVNGITVILPCNLIIQFPATYLTPYEVFQGAKVFSAPAAVSIGTTKSGLALEDYISAANPPPVGLPSLFIPYEVAIDGNIVNGRHIAGLATISQQPLNNAGGYIHFIDTTDGTIYVGGDPSVTPDITSKTDPRLADTARVQLNDPDGRFGRVMSPDERFTVDSGNPTIHAETGYPMCVPRSAADNKCPLSNRPLVGGKALKSFTMAAVAGQISSAASANAPMCTACNPTMQAPFMPGDFINYAGTMARDALGVYTSTHTVAAWLGIFTSPGTKPAYVTIEDSRIGSFGPSFATFGIPDADQERANRISLVGFSTDPITPVEIYAKDVNPNSGPTQGDETPRLLGTSNRGFAVDGRTPIGRFKFIFNRKAGLLPPTREVRAKLSNHLDDEPEVANGLVPGQYNAPLGEFIFSEQRVFGNRQIPADFQCIQFLAQGVGIFRKGEPNSISGVGKLDPWPGSISEFIPDPAPAAWPKPGSCPPGAPIRVP
jgi:hypothetical protein